MKKELVYMYIEEFQGLHRMDFNFSAKDRFKVRSGEDNKFILIRKEDYENPLPENFWGKNISDINLLIGDNGSGKTTVMQMICRWICLLSEGFFPQEEGILVFKEEEDLKYLAFAHGEVMDITADISNFIDDTFLGCKLSDFFEDVKLIYFSNTMTELNLANFRILSDCSMPRRIMDANVQGTISGENIIANYRQHEIIKQMDAVLDGKSGCTVSYMQMEILNQKIEGIRTLFPEKYNDVISDVIKNIEGLWDYYFGKFSKEKSFNGSGLVVELLQAIFYDIILALVREGEESVSVQILKNIAREDNTMRGDPDIKDSIQWMEQFLNDIIFEKKKISDYKSGEEWDDVQKNMRDYIEVILSLAQQNKGEFYEKWNAVPVQEREYRSIRQRKMKKDDKDFYDFWKAYERVGSYMESLRFSWVLSSGERNKLNLFSAFTDIPEEYDNVWVLLDEPDNTFHPEWSRGLLQEIIDACGRCPEQNFELWISTHSPILLSDMPGISVTYLCTQKDENGFIEKKKKAETQFRSTFGQNIYTLFDNAFFLQDGIIGEFADSKIVDTVLGLEKIEEMLSGSKNKNAASKDDGMSLDETGRNMEEYERVAALVAEPIFRHQLHCFVDNCKKLLKKRKAE